MTEIWDKITSFEELYKAANQCSRGVKWKESVAKYQQNILINTLRLQRELRGGSYRLSPYTVFKVFERKERTIVATKMRDRIVQRSIASNYLYDAMTRSFIYDNSACQKGKGTDFARDRFAHHLRSYYNEHGIKGYVLKIDIKDFFGSTDHEVAKRILRTRISDPYVYSYVCRVIDSFDAVLPVAGKGIGLGSEISQLIQLTMLDRLDHKIKEYYRIKHYVRYMDDMLFVSSDLDELRTVRSAVTDELAALGYMVSQKKTHIQPLSQGIHYLGFSFRLCSDGNISRRILPSTIGRARRRMKKHAAYVASGKVSYAYAESCYTAWKAHAAKGDTKPLIKQMDAYFESLYSDWRSEDESDDRSGHGC